MATFQIEDSPIWAEVKNITKSGPNPIKFEYKGMVHNEKEDIPILKIVSIDVMRDYVNNIGDRRVIEFKVGMGDYQARIYPYRTNLEFSIKKIQLKESTGSKDPNAKQVIERFKAVFMPKANPHMATTELSMIDIESLNKTDFVSCKLELLDRSLEPLRIKMVTGVFRNVTAKQIIVSVLGGESQKVQVDGKSSIDGIDVVEPDNASISNHIVLKDGLHITALPTFLQEYMNGVYNAGIGTYLQTYNNMKIWFVYPLFNTERFNNDLNRVVFYSIPQEKLPGIDRTYQVDGSLVKILVNSTRKYKDAAETDYMNHGVGFRQANANSFMKKPVQMTDKGPVGTRTNLVNEVAITNRNDGLNYAPVVSDSISSNPFREYSKVLARAVSRIDLVWENGNADLIYPGMPCKYVFLNNKNVPVELLGCILSIHSFTSMQDMGIANNIYKNVCHMTIVVTPESSQPTVPTTKPVGDF